MNAPLAKEQIALLMSDSLTYRMPTLDGMDGTVDERRATGPFATGPFATVRAWFARMVAMPKRWAVLDELSTLTDRELADIGLNRAELGHVFDERFAALRRV